MGMEGNVITIQDIFLFRQDDITADGRVIGDLHPTGLRPRFPEQAEVPSVST